MPYHWARWVGTYLITDDSPTQISLLRGSREGWLNTQPAATFAAFEANSRE
jgi:hypothetical protein